MVETRSMNKKANGDAGSRRRENFKKGIDRDAARSNRKKNAASSRKDKRSREVTLRRSKSHVVSFGHNDCGQLGQLAIGDGNISEVRAPIEVFLDGNVEIKKVAAGFSRVALLDKDGRIRTCGDNSHGSLGRNTTSSNEDPEKKEEEEDALQARLVEICGGNHYNDVSGGRNHFLMLRGDGELLLTGSFRPESGNLHHYSDEPRLVQIEGLEAGAKIVKIASGGDFCAALASNGVVYTMGLQGPFLGRDSTSDVDFVFRRIEVPLAEGDQAESVVCGEYALFVVTKYGQVSACGKNKYGQLALGDDARRLTQVNVEVFEGKRIASVAAGEYHALFRCEDGTVYACGRGDSGELGTKSKDDINRDNFVFSKIPACIYLPRNAPATMIAAGCRFSMIATKDKVYSFGSGEDGKLGHGDETSHYSPREMDFTRSGLRVNEIKQIAAGDCFSYIQCTGVGDAVPPQDAIALKRTPEEIEEDEEDEDSGENIKPTTPLPSLWELFSQQTDNLWKCSQCDVRNPHDSTACVSCGQNRGNENTTTEAVTNLISDGSSIGEGGFIFGGVASAS